MLSGAPRRPKSAALLFTEMLIGSADAVIEDCNCQRGL